jgi:hypothetical protein
MVMYFLQVRIVHEGMRFPLRLNRHTVITFHVASVFPNNAVGKNYYAYCLLHIQYDLAGYQVLIIV